MTDFVALNTLRDEARQRADQVNSEFVTDAELNGYLNNSWSELYDILVSKYNDDYFLTSTSITVTSGTDTYSLPSDFYKARGVDLNINTNQNTPLQRYNFADRTRDSLVRYARDVKYRIQANNIVFAPSPSNNTATLWYIPHPRKLQSVTPSAISRGSTTTWTVPSTHSFVAGDKINAIGFFATNYNVEQTVSSVTSTTVVTDLDSSALSDPTVYGTLESMQDFVNAGWRQYVSVDSAIMMMLKEESDISGLVYVKQGLLERIEIMAEDRDSGEPARVTNVAAYEQYFMY
jgi:hypothetical protein